MFTPALLLEVCCRHLNEFVERFSVSSLVQDLRDEPAAELPVSFADKRALMKPKIELYNSNPGIAPQTLQRIQHGAGGSHMVVAIRDAEDAGANLPEPVL